MDVENHRTRVTVTQDEGEEGEDDQKRTTVVNVNVINVYEGACNTIHCWASRHSQGFEEKNLGSSPGQFGQ